MPGRKVRWRPDAKAGPWPCCRNYGDQLRPEHGPGRIKRRHQSQKRALTNLQNRAHRLHHAARGEGDERPFHGLDQFAHGQHSTYVGFGQPKRHRRPFYRALRAPSSSSVIQIRDLHDLRPAPQRPGDFLFDSKNQLPAQYARFRQNRCQRRVQQVHPSITAATGCIRNQT
jgi:hypothetical protein